LRVALLEMLHPDLVEWRRADPGRGGYVRAVETAKRSAGAQAPGFVNGVLGRGRLRSVRENGASHA
jgi:N utilization substance protein B